MPGKAQRPDVTPWWGDRKTKHPVCPDHRAATIPCFGRGIIGNTLSVPSTLTLGLPQVSSPGSLSFAFQTTPFCYHTVRQKANLNQPDWENTPTNSTLPVNPFFGTGSSVQITLPISGSGAVFYNVNVSLGP